MSQECFKKQEAVNCFTYCQMLRETRPEKWPLDLATWKLWVVVIRQFS